MSSLPLRSPVRVHPFAGLVIDVDTWATAHDYHRRHQQLHLLALHGCGVVQGLEILPTDPPGETVVVEPGLAIDHEGNVIIVPERQHLALGNGEGLSYIQVEYVESIPSSAGDQKDMRARVLEDFRLRVLRTPPAAGALELARVSLGPPPRSVLLAANPWSPGFNEVDTRFRLQLQARAPRELSVGLMLHGDESDLAPGHLTGFQFFLRELELNGLRASLVTAPPGAVPEADLLYLTASGETPVPAKLTKALHDRVAGGAWLLADPCGPATEMTQSLRSAFAGDDRGETENAVLSARYVFGAAPAGAFPTREIAWCHNALISPRDYGCAWSGRRGEQVFQRELVRSALEFGVNVGFAAATLVSAR